MTDIPYGFCHCGCGGKTRIAERTHTRFGHFKGEPLRFIFNHQHKIRTGPKHSAWKGGMFLDRNGYRMVYCPNHPRARGKYVLEHILQAEKALGKLLPKKVQVHHHTKTQLVICENQEYHRLLHQRMRALRNCGHANWRKCKFCKLYDDPKHMYIKKNQAYHNLCSAIYQRQDVTCFKIASKASVSTGDLSPKNLSLLSTTP